MSETIDSESWAIPDIEYENLKDIANPSRNLKLDVMKVNQLDSSVIDRELHNLLKIQLSRIFTIFPDGFTAEYKPEIEAILNLLLWKYTVFSQKPTPGMRLQNLRYRNEGSKTLNAFAPNSLHMSGIADPTLFQRICWGLGYVAVPYFFSFMKRYGLANGWSHAPENSPINFSWRLLSKLKLVYRIGNIFNMLSFLYSSKYPTLLDRILKLRMVYGNQNIEPRQINYAFVSRRLLWDHFTSFAAAAAPLLAFINISSLLRKFKKFLRSNAATPEALSIISTRNCSECGETPPCEPYLSNCGHAFCYYCLRTACEIEVNYCCPVCKIKVANSRPL